MHELPKTGTGKIARQALLNGQSRLPRIGKRTRDRFWHSRDQQLARLNVGFLG
jgi:hypothetical protein